MENTISALFGWTLLVLLFAYYLHKKSKERIALIEKGIDPNKENLKNYIGQTSLRNGIFFVSAAIGFIFGFIINSIVEGDDNNFIIYAITLLLFCGIGLIIYSVLLKKISKQ